MVSSVLPASVSNDGGGGWSLEMDNGGEFANAVAFGEAYSLAKEVIYGLLGPPTKFTTLI